MHQPISNSTVQIVRTVAMRKFKNEWFEIVHYRVGPSARGGNKLRTCLNIYLKLDLTVKSYPSVSKRGDSKLSP